MARNAAKGEQVVRQIQVASGNPKVELLQADLSVLAQVRELAAQFRARYDRLDVLVNNAGGFFMQRQVSAEGIEMTWALNYLSVFLLSNLLLDCLQAAAPSRIVNVASDMQRSARLDLNDLESNKRYSGMRAYGQSKLAVIIHTYELARRLEATGVTVNALHPGFVATNIYGNSGAIIKRLGPLINLFGVSPEKGARTSLYLASSPDVSGVSGKYFIDSAPVVSNKASYDPELARRLWDLSAAATGLQSR